MVNKYSIFQSEVTRKCIVSFSVSCNFHKDEHVPLLIHSFSNYELILNGTMIFFHNKKYQIICCSPLASHHQCWIFLAVFRVNPVLCHSEYSRLRAIISLKKILFINVPTVLSQKAAKQQTTLAMRQVQRREQ